MALLWVLSLSDGTRSLLEIAERSGIPFGGHSAGRPIASRSTTCWSVVP